MPLHFTVHWALMVMDTKAHFIYHYDSTKTSNPTVHAATAMELIGPSGQVWEQVKVDDLPQQRNVYDCGAFVCLSAAYHYIQEAACGRGRKTRFRCHAALDMCACTSAAHAQALGVKRRSQIPIRTFFIKTNEGVEGFFF
eukprot:scpid88666/ scgid1371/ 